MFIGKYEPLRRPVYAVDASLMGRLQKAKKELTARGKDVVSVRETDRASPSASLSLCTTNRRSDSSAVLDPCIVNRVLSRRMD
jgi:hypothetical protein